MDREETTAVLRKMIGEYLAAQGLDLVDLVYRYEGRDLALRILVDEPQGGISLGECARLNYEIGRMLDENEFIDNRYILEVSSPGLDRPLVTKNDFLRCLKKRVRFFLTEPINGKLEWEGAILKADDEAVYVDIGEELVIPLSKINKAKQII
jgi:ribosome maturation factor RimP